MNEERKEPQGPALTQSRSDIRRRDLVIAAYHILAERGFEGLRVREVAAQVGVNIATLHYYFPTKEVLIGEVVRYLFQQFVSVTAPVPEGYEATPPEQLLQIFVDLRYQLEHVPELFVVLNELHLHARRNPAVHASLQQLHAGWQEHIESICADGVQRHFFHPDLDVHLTASLVMALVKGMSLQVATQLDTFDFEQAGNLVLQSLLPVPPTHGTSD